MRAPTAAQLACGAIAISAEPLPPTVASHAPAA
jgi:hypothetical protein